MHIEYEAELALEDGTQIKAFVDIEYEVESSGAGAHEYWGAKGYDRGTTYGVPSSYNIQNVQVWQLSTSTALGQYVDVELTDMLRRQIMLALDSPDEQDRIAQAIDKDLADRADNESDNYNPPPDYD